MSRRELKALLWASAIILAGLAGFSARERVTYREEFRIYNSPKTLPVAGMIDINTAPAYELMLLPNIGVKRAEDIIQYRDKHGPFRNIEELKNIRGIGPATVEALRMYAACSQSADRKGSETE